MLIATPYFTHAQRLERHLGAEAARIAQAMRPWYGPAIPLLNVPGVYALKGGEFAGRLEAGAPSNLTDYYLSRLRRTTRGWALAELATARAGFASYSDFLAEWTINGKGQSVTFNKSLGTQVIGGCTSAWFVGNQPSAGGVSSASPTGRTPTSATPGAMVYVNPSGGDYMFLVSAEIINTVGGSILCYDRLFDVIKLMSSNATEAVSGVPTRYVGSTPGATTFASGNFVFPEVTSAGALGATAHNWTVCQYTDQDGNLTQTIPSIAGVSGAIANSIDLVAGNWFMPLAAGDTGIKALTQMQCSAVVTGALNFVIGRPIGWMPCEMGLRVFPRDYLAPGGVFNPSRIFDGACLSFLSILAGAATAPIIAGQVNICAG